jgi:hypothetical protein
MPLLLILLKVTLLLAAALLVPLVMQRASADLFESTNPKVRLAVTRALAGRHNPDPWPWPTPRPHPFP